MKYEIVGHWLDGDGNEGYSYRAVKCGHTVGDESEISEDGLCVNCVSEREKFLCEIYDAQPPLSDDDLRLAHDTGLKVFGIVLDEALNRGLIATNPARKLNIQTEETPLRPEITPAMEAVIWRELVNRPDWMRHSFFVAINTGLRFATTRLHRSQIRLSTDDIVIEKPKGGRKREFAIPIYESLRPFLNEFLADGREYLWTAPTRGILTGLEWSKFFHASSAYVPGLCFHSTRVTFISRCMRAGVPEPVVMRLVNHCSVEISRIYQRWTGDDLRQYAARIDAGGGR